MFDPISLGVMAGMGLYSAYNKFDQGKSAQAKANAARKRFDQMMLDNKADQSNATQNQKSEATDIRTGYLTTRDPNKAQGLAQMYQSGMSNYRNEIAGLKKEYRDLSGQREKIESPTNAEIYGGVAGDLASTAVNMYGTYQAGVQQNIANHDRQQMMQMIQDPTKQYIKYNADTDPNSLGNQFSSMWQSTKNMFGDSDYQHKFSNAPITMPDISEMPDKGQVINNYKINNDKINNDVYNLTSRPFTKQNSQLYDKWNKYGYGNPSLNIKRNSRQWLRSSTLGGYNG